MVFTKEEFNKWEKMKEKVKLVTLAFDKAVASPDNYRDVLLILNQCFSGLVVKKQPLFLHPKDNVYVCSHKVSFYITPKGLTFQDLFGEKSYPLNAMSSCYYRDTLALLVTSFAGVMVCDTIINNLANLKMPTRKKKQLEDCKKILTDLKSYDFRNGDKEEEINIENICNSLHKCITPFVTPEQSLCRVLIFPTVLRGLAFKGSYTTTKHPPEYLEFCFGGWLGIKLELEDYINLSEPQIYNECMVWFDECISKLDVIKKSKKNKYAKFIEDHSEYVVAYNLGQGRV